MGLLDELSAIAGKVSDTAVKVAGDYRTITGADGSKVPQSGAPALPAEPMEEPADNSQMERVRSAPSENVNLVVQWCKDHPLLAGAGGLGLVLGLIFAAKKLLK